MSAWAMRQVPSGSIGRARLELLDLFLHPKIPGDVGHQITDPRKRSHRLDGHGPVDRQLVEPRHAHELWHAIDFRRAGPALARFAIPAAREVVRLPGLDVVDGIEHDHALGNLRLIVHEVSAIGVAAPDLEDLRIHSISSMTCLRSGGIGEIGSCRVRIEPSESL